jgi:hypothetical protein
METSKAVLNEYSDPMVWKDFLEFKNYILQEKLSKKYKSCQAKGFSWCWDYTDIRQTRGAKKIPKTVLKARLRIKETTNTLVVVKNLVVSFQSY